MTNLIEKISAKYSTSFVSNETVCFSSDGNEFCFTDGTLYQVFDDRFGASGKAVKTLNAVDRFVALRA